MDDIIKNLKWSIGLGILELTMLLYIIYCLMIFKNIPLLFYSISAMYISTGITIAYRGIRSLNKIILDYRDEKRTNTLCKYKTKYKIILINTILSFFIIGSTYIENRNIQFICIIASVFMVGLNLYLSFYHYKQRFIFKCCLSNSKIEL